MRCTKCSVPSTKRSIFNAFNYQQRWILRISMFTNATRESHKHRPELASYDFMHSTEIENRLLKCSRFFFLCHVDYYYYYRFEVCHLFKIAERRQRWQYHTVVCLAIWNVLLSVFVCLCVCVRMCILHHAPSVDTHFFQWLLWLSLFLQRNAFNNNINVLNVRLCTQRELNIFIYRAIVADTEANRQFSIHCEMTRMSQCCALLNK